jgi:hypothetical protein
VVRSGETLSRIGKMAELFDDHSPLQLMASGRFKGQAFTLIGRLQYKSPAGVWTEWIAWFDDGTTAFLGEDNGAYVFTRPRDIQRDLPAASVFRVGAGVAISGQPYTVAFSDQVTLIAAQGELPKLPPLGFAFGMVELRSETGEVLSIDYGSTPPQLTAGQSVQLEALELSGLKEESVKAESARQFSCPNCGAAVEITLATTQSLTCRSCNSIIDVSQGMGGELRHAIQDEPVGLLIPLGSSAQLQGAQWQVVGFQHRMGRSAGEDESFGWSEYLLFNQKRGFSFLVDAEDGWSLVRPATGAPRLSADGQSASYLGANYTLQYAYDAETTYVCGEFYWPVSRGQKTANRDYASGRSLLSQERQGNEITWSSGSLIDASLVASAFKLEQRKEQFERHDATPAGSLKRLGCGTIVLIFIVIVVLLILLSRCSTCDPAVENCNSSAYRSTGGSYGGFSAGGGHK